MRRYVLGLLLIFWGICGGQAQTVGRYKMTLTFHSIKNTGNDMINIIYRVFSISNAGEEELYGWASGGIARDRYIATPAPIIRYIDTSENKLPIKLKFRGRRVWKGILPWITGYHHIIPRQYTSIF